MQGHNEITSVVPQVMGCFDMENCIVELLEIHMHIHVHVFVVHWLMFPLFLSF